MCGLPGDARPLISNLIGRLGKCSLVLVAFRSRWGTLSSGLVGLPDFREKLWREPNRVERRMERCQPELTHSRDHGTEGAQWNRPVAEDGLVEAPDVESRT